MSFRIPPPARSALGGPASTQPGVPAQVGIARAGPPESEPARAPGLSGLTGNPPGGGRSARVPEPSRGAGEGPPEAPVPPRAARRRVPELAVGVVLIGLGAIGALVLAGQQAPRAAVLVWANDVTRGQVVEASDLKVASIDTDTPVDVVDVAAVADVVGRSVALDANAGGFVSGSLLKVGSVIPPDSVVVGLRLGAGRYPVSTLAVGDIVDVLTTEPLIGWDDPVVVSGVEVFDVLWLGGGEGSEALVSLLVPRTAAPRVVAATAAGPRLAKVAS